MGHGNLAHLKDHAPRVGRNGVTVLRTVEVDLMNDDLAEITDGLVEGHLVVAHPWREITADLGVENRLVE
jgi:hypothetical protein